MTKINTVKEMVKNIKSRKLPPNKFKSPTIGARLKVRLPNDFSMKSLPDYGVFSKNYEDLNLRKWCIEQAASNIVKAAKIYKWVKNESPIRSKDNSS